MTVLAAVVAANPAQVSLDTLTASIISATFSIIVSAITFMLQRNIKRSEEEREKRESEAEAERKLEQAKRDAEHDCTASMARAKLVTMATDFTAQGFMPFEARRTFDALYHSYEQMGEDGLIQETVERARALPMYPPNEGDSNEVSYQ